MYCSQCGAKAEGNFCANCGARLVAPVPAPGPKSIQDWSREIRYAVLVQNPEVRGLISQYAAQAKKRMSGEEFLKVCDKAISPLTGGISLETIASIAQPLYAKLGIKTGKTRGELLPTRPGTTLVAVFCSLVRQGQTVQNVQQAQDGCLIQAVIPSDMWSFAGDLLITVKRQELGTFVEAGTVIKGQLFDWGKSKNILKQLFEDLHSIPRGFPSTSRQPGAAQAIPDVLPVDPPG